ncbi:DUF3891 family protein [Paenibacillus oceani]|uniref:DUF3891 family protein n=1 Tax=Paenibacillus oceani TaxID=2772510 RepID=A0A927CCL0_9BACL|nr:DUF3891 family protein [Paenibacillus oceani]MBD2863380.1 DUF3891 family protein [Paenibacillus oceani]
MIVRCTEHQLVLTTQHDHARLSGDIARAFSPFLEGDPYLEDALVAVYQHDIGWVRLDETPVWNDRFSLPFSFTDYPLLPKLTHYTFGLDQVESMNPYAALLCSMHYCSFSVFQDSVVEACIDFTRHELERQRRISAGLGLTNREELLKQLQLLQLCDRISLYVCMNEPGAAKEKEHPWYKAGFSDSERFSPKGDTRLTAGWMSDTEIELTPNPFEHTFRTEIIQRTIDRRHIEQVGIAEAYAHSESVVREIVFAGRNG